MGSFSDFIQDDFKTPDKMTKDELEKEVQTWRNLWTWLEPEVQHWLSKIGEEVALKARDYKVMAGFLGQPHFVLESLELTWVDKEYNYFKKEATYITKSTTIRVPQLADFSFIIGKEVRREGFSGEPVPEETEEELENLELGKE